MSNTYKPFCDVEKQIQLLEDRGITFNKRERKFAREYFSTTNYFKFSKIYKNPIFADSLTHKLKEERSFSFFIKIYNFEIEIANLTLKYILFFETLIRTKFAYNISQSTSCNTPYLEEKFINENKKEDFFKYKDKFSYKKSIKRSPTLTSILKHYYNSHSEGYPPIWAIVECIDFGDLRYLINMFKVEYLDNFYSSVFGVNNFETSKHYIFINFFKNFLGSINELRNFCAHNNIIFGSPFRLNNFEKVHGHLSSAKIFKEANNFALVINSLYFMLFQADKKLAKKCKKNLFRSLKKLVWLIMKY